MKIAVIGSGISGLTSAYLLNKKYDVHLIEKTALIGGHTATKDITYDGKSYAIDTGFIVFNDRTYPGFNKLLAELGVDFQESSMGFSVSDSQTGLEYAGNNLRTLFSQKRNALNPTYLKMLSDIVRFNKLALKELEAGLIAKDLTLSDYLEKHRFGQWFQNYYLKPMGSAIWSTSLEDMKQFPLYFFVRFFKNHGLLDLQNRPQWYVIKGGSKSYIDPLIKTLKNPVRLNTTITKVERNEEGVILTFDTGEIEHFDQVVFACHSDQALALLGDAASDDEKAILGAIPYTDNSVILHTDKTLLPKRKMAWSSWNYLLGRDKHSKPILTYNMNILQSIDAPVEFCVSLNADHLIDKSSILGHYHYSHPKFTLASEQAVARWGDINGHNKSWFTGAYWANGFHEDGVQSALRVTSALGVTL